MNTSPIAWADPARAYAFGRWLATIAPQHQLRADTVRPASADASFRRYFRVDAVGDATGRGSYIIMDAPPAQEDCKPFIKVAGLLLDAGLNAPRVLAWDEPLGFMLLSDLGAQTMLDLIEPPAAVDAIAQPTSAHFDLYMDAVDTLVRWQLASQPGVLPPYDEALLSRELALFPEWYVAQHRGFALDTGLQDKLDGLFAQIKASNLQSLGGARVYVHRDFMPRNLMAPTLVASRTALPPEGAVSPWGGPAAKPDGGEPGLGILDFQDAVYGPITYDIASLMRDAFLTWEEDFVLDITVRYWQKARKAGLPVGDDFGEFYRAVEWMGLQRHLKVLGIFARLTRRDGKPKYLADTPRFIKYARNTAARYRQLGPLMVLLDQIEGNETRVGYTF
ncbi:MAG TPA: aminoglycoside phosphotransferase [Polaromonas sp.]|uniref:aminoglycoside phosphotransferase family protein n=1 Tax=Polaromonas sp. UBA4122 TaxID=1947074 RepID=UPI000EC85ED4|nr:phosphotransferase [Polaromonas sp. UBA4122]HAL40536.1 aminoglycoside phosphotransferase [Polaromonas sp.]